MDLMMKKTFNVYARTVIVKNQQREIADEPTSGFPVLSKRLDGF